MLVGNDAALELYVAEGFTVTERKDGKLVGNERLAASACALARRGGLNAGAHDDRRRLEEESGA